MRTRGVLSVTAAAFLACAGCGSAHAEPAPTAAVSRTQEVEAVRARLSRSAAGLNAERQPDGSVRVRLQGRYQSLSLRDARGRTTCLDSPEGLDRMLDVSR